MKLFGTFPSHFTRKARVVLQELGLDYEFSVITGLLETGPEHFAQNPLHQLPILEDGKRQIIESDLICRYLIENYAKRAPSLRYLPSSGDALHHEKRLAVMNGGMAAGVKLIRAERSNIPNFMEFPFFRQEQAALEASLRWLEEDLGSRDSYQAGEFTLLDITLMSFLEWATFREFVSSYDAHPNLRAFVVANRDRPSFANTHPAREGVEK